MRYLDSHPNVIQWSSEEIIIPYVSPMDNRIHRYFPDFWIKIRDKDGNINTMLVEIKPMSQVREPVVQKKMTKRYLTEVKTYAVNSAKWKAANEFCSDRKWIFKIMTEKDLGVGKK